MASRREPELRSKVDKTLPKMDNQVEAEAIKGPATVHFRRVIDETQAISYTVEDLTDQGSRNLWQVYAVGAFMIVRWLWARWGKRSNDNAINDES
ncbi:hypothetical protein KP509_13G023400 [Ceratopteris richardii]|uniref:Uncharacterized protein n=1 Tax=Ceratopteris richardii TaxID=49495 RepID=A0A8T2TC34_CERRI|nr:hypothetical protein KP509_13G023400 [Ceratopteris richardii]